MDGINPGSVNSNDVTVSRDLDNHLSKASSSSGRLSKRVWQSHLLRLCMKIQVYKAVVPTLMDMLRLGRSGYLSDFTSAACIPSLTSNGKTIC